MRSLPFTIPLLILLMALKLTDSPHGDDFKVSCGVCHSQQAASMKKTFQLWFLKRNEVLFPVD